MTQVGNVLSLRRYPVKTMGGEALDAIEVIPGGVQGDRRYAFVDDDGHWASGKNGTRWRRHDEVFEYSAATTGGSARVEGAGGSWAVDDPALAAHLSGRFGVDVHLLEASQPQTDGSSRPVSLIGSATLDWCTEHLGVDADPRRLRVNIIVETSEPFVEETWVDRHVSVGASVLRVVKKIDRCRMIDLAQDGTAAQVRWLKPLMATRQGFASIGAAVVSPGTVRLGDAVALVEPALFEPS